VATKFGIAGFDANGMLVKGTPDYVRACCEASLERLAVDYIDLYYQHRIDQSVPIEETVCMRTFLLQTLCFTLNPLNFD
jgi:aryl-alcohol dehydrogenase-like predicted oxidoreductase